jgi:hypothetical protein
MQVVQTSRDNEVAQFARKGKVRGDEKFNGEADWLAPILHKQKGQNLGVSI